MLKFVGICIPEVMAFEFHPPVFKKVTYAGLNSLQQNWCHISVKVQIFDELFHKKWAILVILMPLMIKPSGPGSFFLRTSESSWFLNLIRGLKYFSLVFWKKKHFWQNHENSCWIFYWRLLRPACVTFSKTGGWNSNTITSRYLTQIPSNKI